MVETKQRLTTNEAAKLALKLHNEGKAHIRIAKILARNGYISFRTGKPLSSSAVSALVCAAREGRELHNKTTTMYSSAIGKYLPRASRSEPAATQPSLTTKEQEPITGGSVLGNERVARETMTRAMERALKSIFGVPAKVLIPLDVQIRCPQP